MAFEYPVTAEFISHPKILPALAELGFPEPIEMESVPGSAEVRAAPG
jgi:hypothetical protein